MASTAWSLLMLLLVLALIPLALWSLQKLQALRVGGAPRALQVSAQLALGARERVVLLQVDGRTLLLGVTPQQVTLLAECSSDAAVPTPASPLSPAAPAAFAGLLRAAAGLRPGKAP